VLHFRDAVRRLRPESENAGARPVAWVPAARYLTAGHRRRPQRKIWDVGVRGRPAARGRVAARGLGFRRVGVQRYPEIDE